MFINNRKNHLSKILGNFPLGTGIGFIFSYRISKSLQIFAYRLFQLAFKTHMLLTTN